MSRIRMTVHTLPKILTHVAVSRGKIAKQGIRDRGYRGKSEVDETQIILPKKALKNYPLPKR
jgi:transposase, IS5 family